MLAEAVAPTQALSVKPVAGKGGVCAACGVPSCHGSRVYLCCELRQLCFCLQGCCQRRSWVGRLRQLLVEVEEGALACQHGDMGTWTIE